MREGRSGRSQSGIQASMTIQQDDKSLGELVASATKDLSALVKGEVELAKAEIRQEVKAAAKGGVMLGAAGFSGYLALVFLSVAAAFAIGVPLTLGWGFLVVGGLYLLVAAALGLKGRSSLTAMGKPERTIRQAKETSAWARHPTRTTE
jgi:hypothetical protein